MGVVFVKMASPVTRAARSGSGRKRKAAKDWVLDYPDNLQTLLKMPKGQGAEESSTSHVLVCRFCSIELPTDPKKKPWDRINEHLSSMRHKKLKEGYKERSDKKQVSLYESVVRQKEKEKEAEGAIHDFVRALCYSAISLNQADSYLGKLFKKYCQAARTMPGRRQLEAKYLPEVYAHHKSIIIDMMKDVKISAIIDESPDILGRPAVNTLFCYFNKKNRVKKHSSCRYIHFKGFK